MYRTEPLIYKPNADLNDLIQVHAPTWDTVLVVLKGPLSKQLQEDN